MSEACKRQQEADGKRRRDQKTSDLPYFDCCSYGRFCEYISNTRTLFLKKIKAEKESKNKKARLKPMFLIEVGVANRNVKKEYQPSKKDTIAAI